MLTVGVSKQWHGCGVSYVHDSYSTPGIVNKCGQVTCSSRQEMAHAVHVVQSRVKDGSIASQDVTAHTLQQELYTQVCDY